MKDDRRRYYEQALEQGLTQREMAEALGIAQPVVCRQLRALNAEIEASQESEIVSDIRASRKRFNVIDETESLAALWRRKIDEAESPQEHRIYGRLELDSITLLARLRREDTQTVRVEEPDRWTPEDDAVYADLCKDD